MATIMAHDIPPNSLTIPEDDMEISSDLGQQYGDDYLDIDIDLEEHFDHTLVDDEMIEDEAANDTNNPAADQEMDDEIIDDDGHMTYDVDEQQLSATHVDYEGDTEIVEGHDSFEDTIVEDVNDIYPYQETAMSLPVADQVTQLDFDPTKETDISYHNHDDEVSYHDIDIGEQEQRVGNPAELDLNILHEHKLAVPELVTPGEVDESSRAPGAVDVNQESLPTELSLASTNFGYGEAVSPHAAATIGQPMVSADVATLDNDIPPASSKTDAAGSELCQEFSHKALGSGAHPIIIVYEEQEINLFPTTERNETTPFFLASRSLVGQNLRDFLGACRTVLRDHVTENEELQIEVAQLDLALNEVRHLSVVLFTKHTLTVSQDSNQASLFSLDDMVDVFVQLCQNDGIESPEPLYITLAVKSRFESRMTDLISSMRDGKGLSHVFADTNVGTHADEEHDYVDVDAGEYHADGVQQLTGDDQQDGIVEQASTVVEPATDAHKSEEGIEKLDHAIANANVESAPADIKDGDSVPLETSADEKQLINAALEENELFDEGIGELKDSQVHATNAAVAWGDQHNTTEYFDDDLLEYSDDDEVEGGEAVTVTNSSSSSTVQGDTSAIDLIGNELDETVEGSVATSQLPTKHVENIEGIDLGPDLFEEGEEDIDYSLYDSEHVGNETHEYQDNLDESEFLNSLVNDVTQDDVPGTGVEEPIAQDLSPFPVNTSSADEHQFPPQSTNETSQKPSTPSRKRSRFEEEDELVDTDTESDFKKPRSA